MVKLRSIYWYLEFLFECFECLIFVFYYANADFFRDYFIGIQLSCCLRKPTIWGSEQIRHKPACTGTDEGRQNTSIGIPLDLSIPTEMTCIEPLVANEKSSKTPNKLKIILCYIFSD